MAKEEARILTKLFDNSRDDITLSFSSRIFKTYSALLLPFFILYIILAFEVAVMAVSEPDSKPDKITSIIKQINKK